MPMKIHFLGGADEVGASCLLLEMGGLRILVDAGVRVSPKASQGLSGELLPDLSPLNDGKLDAVVITHAHADHIGAVPQVLGSMPEVPVYCTPATISIMSVMFRDALHIMDSRLESDGEMPQYDLLQVQRVENACRPTDLKQEFSIKGAVNVTFFRAGHIPGAASVYFQSDEGSILVSGDLSFSPMRATPEGEIPPVRPDALVLETTYGGKLHANRRAEEQRLIDSIKRVIERGGRVLIPAFALGRAQEVALILDSAIAGHRMDKIPVYMDGMTRAITQVFERFPDYLSKDLKKHLDDNLTLFSSDAIKYVKSREERLTLVRSPEPAVIISSSGMLTGGASPVYAEQMVKNPLNAIFITGYQDEESPGKALQKVAEAGGGTLYINNHKHEVKCEIGTYSLSAHADENELTQYAVRVEPRRIYLVHGETMARERMRDLLRQRKLSTFQPRLGEMVTFDGEKSLTRRKDAPTVPTYAIPPITSIEDLDLDAPMFDSEDNLYIRTARKAIRQLVPADAGLRKQTFNRKDKSVLLAFDFPAVAHKKYDEKFAQLEQMLGWKVMINESVNMMALNTVARNLLPNLIGRASLHMASQIVEVKVDALPENYKEIQENYLEQTGFRLLFKGVPMPGQTVAAPTITRVTPNGVVQKEINEAYAILRMGLAQHGMYKTGLKSGVIVLSFITPEVGARLENELMELSQSVGYPLEVHPQPNQHAIITLVTELCQQREIRLMKNPSISIDQRAVTIEPQDPLSEDNFAEIKQAFNVQTGWELRLKMSVF